MKSRMFLVIVIMIKVFKFFKSNLQKLVRNTSKNKQPTTNNEKKEWNWQYYNDQNFKSMIGFIIIVTYVQWRLMWR